MRKKTYFDLPWEVIEDGSSISLAHVPQLICRWGLKCHKGTYFLILLIIFFVSEHLSSATKKGAKCYMWHLCLYLRKLVIEYQKAIIKCSFDFGKKGRKNNNNNNNKKQTIKQSARLHWKKTKLLLLSFYYYYYILRMYTKNNSVSP